MFATECVERFIERDEFVIAIEEGNSVGEMRGGRRRSVKREKSSAVGFLMAHESSHSSRFHQVQNCCSSTTTAALLSVKGKVVISFQ